MKNIRLKRFIINGWIIVYPTESCFGLGCDPYNIFAIKKIIQIKKRMRNKNFIVIASEINQLTKLIKPLDEKNMLALSSKWPGPHTWLLNVNKNCPSWLNSEGKIAIRIPSLNNKNRLLSSLGMTLTSTSANKSGKKPIKNYRDACRFFKSSVKIIKGRVGGFKNPSTIQDFNTKRVIRRS